MADPAVRAAILSEDPKKGNTFPLFHRMSFDFMFRFGNPPNYQPDPKDSVAAIAARGEPDSAGSRLRHPDRE